MRNVFDQYQQPENRLTHALVSTLAADRTLIRPFLQWLDVPDVPPEREIHVVEQQVPGTMVPGDEDEASGLPDISFFSDDGWSALIEAKVQAGLPKAQLSAHLRSARSCGYEKPHLIVLAVDRVAGQLPHDARAVEWREVYCWFRGQSSRSWWARHLVDYMHVFESQMIAQNYSIRGTLTMFDGLHFDEENPYTYREGKRLIRLLGDELRQRKDLRQLGIDPKGAGRPAITGRGQDRVWDFIPLKAARGSTEFTSHPHLTLSIGKDAAVAAVTVPNGVKGGFKTKLREAGLEGFQSLIADVEQRIRPVVRSCEGAQPTAYLLQRHYLSQRSAAHVDGRLSFDLRTTLRDKGSRFKYQPEWMEAMYALLVNKRSNIQMGLDVRLPYQCPVVRSRNAADLFARTWIAAEPLLNFVLD